MTMRFVDVDVVAVDLVIRGNAGLGEVAVARLERAQRPLKPPRRTMSAVSTTSPSASASCSWKPLRIPSAYATASWARGRSSSVTHWWPGLRGRFIVRSRTGSGAFAEHSRSQCHDGAMDRAHPERPFVSRREFLRRTGIFGAAAAAGPWFWRQLAYAEHVPVEQLHLTFGRDAAREVTVSFVTRAPVHRPFVELAGQRWPARTVQYSGYPGFIHHVSVGGLDPDTTYAYRAGHGDTVVSETFEHRTGPAGRARFVFTAFGDQGVDGPVVGLPPVSQPPNQASANTALARSLNPAFHLIVGDLAYVNGDQTIWDAWFRMIEPMAARVPWMPCLGNHEIEAGWRQWGYDPYRTRFRLPANDSVDYDNCFYAFRRRRPLRCHR
jgi:hypothetical protein